MSRKDNGGQQRFATLLSLPSCCLPFWLSLVCCFCLWQGWWLLFIHLTQSSKIILTSRDASACFVFLPSPLLSWSHSLLLSHIKPCLSACVFPLLIQTRQLSLWKLPLGLWHSLKHVQVCQYQFCILFLSRSSFSPESCYPVQIKGGIIKCIIGCPVDIHHNDKWQLFCLFPILFLSPWCTFPGIHWSRCCGPLWLLCHSIHWPILSFSWVSPSNCADSELKDCWRLKLCDICTHRIQPYTVDMSKSLCVLLWTFPTPLYASCVQCSCQIWGRGQEEMSFVSLQFPTVFIVLFCNSLNCRKNISATKLCSVSVCPSPYAVNSKDCSAEPIQELLFLLWGNCEWSVLVWNYANPRRSLRNPTTTSSECTVYTSRAPGLAEVLSQRSPRLPVQYPSIGRPDPTDWQFTCTTCPQQHLCYEPHCIRSYSLPYHSTGPVPSEVYTQENMTM